MLTKKRKWNNNILVLTAWHLDNRWNILSVLQSCDVYNYGWMNRFLNQMLWVWYFNFISSFFSSSSTLTCFFSSTLTVLGSISQSHTCTYCIHTQLSKCCIVQSWDVVDFYFFSLKHRDTVALSHWFHKVSLHLIVSWWNASRGSQQSKEDDGQSKDCHDWNLTNTPKEWRLCYHFSFWL